MYPYLPAAYEQNPAIKYLLKKDRHDTLDWAGGLIITF